MPPKKPAIAFFGVWKDMEVYLAEQMKGLPYANYPSALDPVKINSCIELLVVFVESKVTSAVIQALPQLKYIATMSTGYDHIDLKAAKKRNIAVANVPVYGNVTVAEHTMSLMLGLTRKLFLSAERVKEGIYDFHGLRGVDLAGKTLGVIGTGHIGQSLIKMARGFGLTILAYDLFPNLTAAKKLNFTYTNLNSLLKRSDIITLHIPLTAATYHFINKKNIALIKKGSYLINTARGALVDPTALLKALESGHLAGAGLDVLEDEDLIQNYEEIIQGTCTACELKTSLINKLIIERQNTIVTPHNAFNSTEAIKRIVDTTVLNIKAFIKNKPINLVC
ncbi:MAG: hypothetical protein A3I29_03555 [Candidatus Magasanikbacteria bacterium RIFCSPLOWO2_02_FULL_44_11]|uniref:Hydroxyacid dehydrogenase n=1 Tax=Candidatus Magasanikbacteria bacterium RIFCSPLOWO2_02_FULL_44_11 TaxID=1798689 RepID=A0A1F6NA48_9BACT|nr:MAG: hypothetical protein A3I29_03555 [Candidatus Magasanikbacteria bacterium RIFCSPLOWO2_02_FULL_44_11]